MDSQTTSTCYKCGKQARELSPRSRCVRCEYESNQFNEKENEKLRNQIALLEEDIRCYQADL